MPYIYNWKISEGSNYIEFQKKNFLIKMKFPFEVIISSFYKICMSFFGSIYQCKIVYCKFY